MEISAMRQSRLMKQRAKVGFTLVEVVISVILLGIAFASLAAGFSSGLMSIRAARETSTALQAAQREIETMRDSPFGAIQSHTFSVPALNTTGSVVVESEQTDLKKVSVNVAWVCGGRRNMSISLLTRICQDGIH